MRKKVSEYGFADSAINSFFCTPDGTLTVIVQSWDSRKVEVKFKDIIGIQGTLAYISDFFEEEDFTSYAREALRLNYLQSSGQATIPDKHPYHNYIFLDSEDEIALQVIAESAIVKKYDEILKGNIMTVDEFLKRKENYD